MLEPSGKAVLCILGCVEGSVSRADLSQRQRPEEKLRQTARAVAQRGISHHAAHYDQWQRPRIVERAREKAA